MHQAYLVSNISPGDPQLQTALAGITRQLAHAGIDMVDAAQKGYGMIFRSLTQQANVLAYIDVTELFAIASLLVIPLLFFARHSKPGAGAAAA